jgi:hypothetical protein
MAPGQGILHGSKFTFPNGIQLQAGESQTVEAWIQTGIDFWPTDSISYLVSYGTDYSFYPEDMDIVPLPEGLNVSVMPAEFILYPYTTYMPLILVEAAPQLPPGEYYVTIMSIGPWISPITTRIVVTAPAAAT